ncbi:MAG: ribosome biogenesis GTP-binding protein YihA/YsxC [Flavobacteriales bacterium]
MPPIYKATFEKSSAELDQCPEPHIPEFVFIGRSNVGKSSLINMLCNIKGLAKTSSTPGKTQLINHFLIDEDWYLVDLPGYGYARTSKVNRKMFKKMIYHYIEKRPNLVNVFVLIDARHKPQPIDLQFLEWLGTKGIPFSIVFTKLDKLKPAELEASMETYKKALEIRWEELPVRFETSAEKKIGKDELTQYIQSLSAEFGSQIRTQYRASTSR